ncbi:MAG: hypothetical protein HC927_02510 [Deltaproteobacteria bacterium]|nr:hypothetical protein [Deltaproteobacteria bacterium]
MQLVVGVDLLVGSTGERITETWTRGPRGTSTETLAVAPELDHDLLVELLAARLHSSVLRSGHDPIGRLNLLALARLLVEVSS